MFVGHGLLAFVLVALGARWLDATPHRALVLGAVAAAFATIPDVDVVYGLVGLAGGVAGPDGMLDAFWTAGNVVHRGPTHSLVVGALAAIAFGLVSRSDSPSRVAGVTTLAGLVALAIAVGSALDAAVMALFAIVGLGVVHAVRRFEVAPPTIAALVGVGLLSHPFGDMLTGEPPAFLYPLDATLFDARIALHPDPTVHLLAAFAIEIAVVWAALAVYFDLTDRDLWAHVDRRSIVGVGYGAAAFVLPAPTLEAAEPFVLSVLALGVVGVTPTRSRWRPVIPRAVATGLAAVTLAAATYAVVYFLV